MRAISTSLALIALSFAASAANTSDAPVASLTQASQGDVSLHQKALEEDLALELAPIKSHDELHAYVENTPKFMSPLEALSPSGRERFLRSLTFNESGITGFSYDDLEAELTPSQIYRVLSLFGAQHLTTRMRGARIDTPLDSALMEARLNSPAPVILPKKRSSQSTQAQHDFPSCPTQPCDYEGYKCVKPSTCENSLRSICMRSC